MEAIHQQQNLPLPQVERAHSRHNCSTTCISNTHPVSWSVRRRPEINILVAITIVPEGSILAAVARHAHTKHRVNAGPS
jgi:hypothetical protein